MFLLQILLGPNAAMSGGSPMLPGMMPPMPPHSWCMEGSDRDIVW